MKADRGANKEAYFLELDGLRFLAFFLVFMHHATPSRHELPWLKPYCDWGWSGVELFFVLSGFLITYLLLKEKETFGSISIRNFYARRILRIWPLYYLVIFSVALLPLAQAHWSQMAVYWRYLREIILPFSLFVGNYAIIEDFGAIIRICLDWHLPILRMVTIILPFWSLCIEEQFYLVWPWILKAMKSTRVLVLTVAALIAGSVVSLYILRQFAWLSGRGYNYFYLSTPAHIDSLMAGAAIAVAEIRYPGWATRLFRGWRGLLCGAILAGSVYAICNFGVPIFQSRSSAFWLMCAVSALCALSLLLALYWQPLRSLLSSPLLTRLGRLTYAMYVFHFFLLNACSNWLSRELIPNDTTFWIVHTLLTFALTYAAAQISWVCLETRMLALRKQFRRVPLPVMPLVEKEIELSAV